jgi:hypothetical protein
MVTSVTKGGQRNRPKNVRVSKPTNITIHRKALEKHFQMVPLILGDAFSEFS